VQEQQTLDKRNVLVRRKAEVNPLDTWTKVAYGAPVDPKEKDEAMPKKKTKTEKNPFSRFYICCWRS
jgi:hypothetical protein